MRSGRVYYLTRLRCYIYLTVISLYCELTGETLFRTGEDQSFFVVRGRRSSANLPLERSHVQDVAEHISTRRIPGRVCFRLFLGRLESAVFPEEIFVGSISIVIELRHAKVLHSLKHGAAKTHGPRREVKMHMR
jgi:hypothetical protein